MSKITKSKVLVSIIILILLTVSVFWYYFIGFSRFQPGYSFNKQQNAIWIKHEWIEKRMDLAQIRLMAQELKEKDIKYIFVHSGPFEQDGKVDFTKYKSAKYFIESYKAVDPDAEILAWLGQIYSKIDLDQEQTLDNIMNVSNRMISLGYDGIHLDIEPIKNDDQNFINLLKRYRKDLPEVFLSVAISEYVPNEIFNVWDFFTDNTKNYLSEEYYKEISNYTDQIAVMVYDTPFTNKLLFSFYVNRQTLFLSRNIQDTEVLIGIPTYDETHETIESSIKGVIGGLNDIRSNLDNFTGIAIYSNWETDEEEWQIYQDYFQKND